jgi:hypothetical protein
MFRGLAHTLLVVLLLLTVINPFLTLSVILFFLAPLWITKEFALFLLLPLAISICVAALVTKIIHAKLNLSNRWPAPFAILFLTAFLGGCEIYARHIIGQSAHEAAPECQHIDTFMHSIARFGHGSSGHAHYTKNGKTYFWSYRAMKFTPSESVTWPCSNDGSHTIP